MDLLRVADIVPINASRGVGYRDGPPVRPRSSRLAPVSQQVRIRRPNYEARMPQTEAQAPVPWPLAGQGSGAWPAALQRQWRVTIRPFFSPWPKKIAIVLCARWDRRQVTFPALAYTAEQAAAFGMSPLAPAFEDGQRMYDLATSARWEALPCVSYTVDTAPLRERERPTHA